MQLAVDMTIALKLVNCTIFHALPSLDCLLTNKICLSFSKSCHGKLHLPVGLLEPEDVEKAFRYVVTHTCM